MGLKQIPQEEGTKRKTKAKKSPSLMEKLRKKLSLKEVSRDEKIVGKTCMKLVRYVTEGQDFQLDDVKSLLADMERSVIVVQRKKKTLVEKKNKKR